ncbi:hypothetical protein QTP70_028511, partial [Hemibagrus guttatus]
GPSSILSSCITAWFGDCTVLDRKTLQQIVKTGEIIGVSLPSITDIYAACCVHKANSIVNDPTHPSHTLLHTPHPSHTLFTLLPSVKSTSGPGGMLSHFTVYSISYIWLK